MHLLEAADPACEDRALRLRGAFTAEPARYQTRTLSAGGR